MAVGARTGPSDPWPGGRWPFGLFRSQLFECVLEALDRTLDVLELVQAKQPDPEGLVVVRLVAHQRHGAGDL